VGPDEIAELDTRIATVTATLYSLLKTKELVTKKVRWLGYGDCVYPVKVVPSIPANIKYGIFHDFGGRGCERGRIYTNLRSKHGNI
jgi:hypothetical protein